MKFDYQKIVDNFLNVLSERSKKIVSRRFALGKKKLETLEKIGKDYGITRERVRQIEVDSIKKIKKNIKKLESGNDFAELQNYFKLILDKSAGIKREDLFIEKLGEQADRSNIIFLLHLADNIFRSKEDEANYAFFSYGKEPIKLSQEIEKKIFKYLKEAGEPLSLGDIVKEIKVDQNMVKSCIEISKRVKNTVNGKKYGLINWPEVNPKTVRDKIFFILKNNDKPLHYKDISENIVRLDSEVLATPVSSKKLHPQTIHNELIRNKNFVLIGRGIYALKEWGYNEGQVKDVISDILKNSKNSLSKDEIVQLVSEKRMVRESTILLNLQNKKMFSRDTSGKYQIRED